MLKMYLGTLSTALFVVLPGALKAQSAKNVEGARDQFVQLQREINYLHEGQQKVEKQLTAIMEILTGKSPSLENTIVSIADAPSIGAREAKVTIVEFTDFQCPFCGEFAKGTFRRLMEDYVELGAVRYVIRNFPLEQSHPLAHRAAEAGLCADEQGKFWAFHDRVFENQSNLNPGDFEEHARAIGADTATFQHCLETEKYKEKLTADLADGRKLGVRGTPTFFIGYSNAADPSRVHVIRSISGDVPYENFQKAITEASEALRQDKVGKK